MSKNTYVVKYRQPGQWFWRTVKGVEGDGIEGNFRFLAKEDGSILNISIEAEVLFPAKRLDLIAKKMSKESGQNIQV